MTKTESDACAAGACAAGTAKDCDDNNECTADTCVTATGCLSEPSGEDCDDNNECTDDACNPAVGCESVPNTATCDDGDACTEGDVCAAGVCGSGAATDCDDEDPCTIDACAAGICTHEPATTPECQPDCQPLMATTKCESGDLFWVDACGERGAIAIPCDDGDPCTLDTCDAAESACKHDPTGPTACAGECEKDPAVGCYQGHVVQFDSCGAPSQILTSCDDAILCTLDQCDVATSECAHGVAPACQDGCDADPEAVCDADDMVVFKDACGTTFAVAELCDDNDETTLDACTDGACVHLPIADPEVEPGPESSGGQVEVAEPNDAPDTAEGVDDPPPVDKGCTTGNSGSPGSLALLLLLLATLAVRRRLF